METFVRDTGDMVRVLEINAEASDLKTDVRLASRKLQSKAVIRGFRPGRVPLKMINRMYAKEIQSMVVEDLIKEVYDDIVVDSGQYKVLGSPREIHRDYEVGGDLEARIEFYVVPKIKLRNIEGMQLDVAATEVNDSVVDLFIKKKMAPFLKTRPLSALEMIADKETGMLDKVTYEVSEVDPQTGRILIGRELSLEKQFFDYNLSGYTNPKYETFRKLFAGHSVGSEITLPMNDLKDSSLAQVEVEGTESNYQVKIVDAQRYDFPEIDDEWAAKISDNEVSSSEQLKDWVTNLITSKCEILNRTIVEYAVIYRMLELHPFIFPTHLRDEFLNQNPELTESIQDVTMFNNTVNMMCWSILVSAIRNQVKEKYGSVTPVDNPQNMGHQPGQGIYQEVIDQLIPQFELKHFSAEPWFLINMIENLSLD